MNIKPLILNTSSKNFEKKLLDQIKINSNINTKAQGLVNKIIIDIKNKKDSSLVSYINKYDGYKIKNVKDIFITKKQIKAAYGLIDKSQLLNLKKSIARITKFSKNQKSISWKYDDDGSILGEKISDTYQLLTDVIVECEQRNLFALIIGGGQAGLTTSVSLRQNHFTGSVLLVGDEDQLPYQRPPLSKDFLYKETIQRQIKKLSEPFL